jgi:hypothetical protein
MAKMLYIEASPRKERSASIKVALEFVDTYREAHPDDRVELLDLWEESLPAFSGDVIDAKCRIDGHWATCPKATPSILKYRPVGALTAEKEICLGHYMQFVGVIKCKQF